MTNIDPWMMQRARKLENMLDTAKVRRAQLIARKQFLPDIAPALDWLDRKISRIESLASLQAEMEVSARKNECEFGGGRATTEQP